MLISTLYEVFLTFWWCIGVFYHNTGCFFLFIVVFDSTSCLHSSSDFVHRYLIFFGRWYAIKWGINHNCIIARCREICQYVKGVFFTKKDRFFDILLEKGKKWYPSDTKFRKFYVFYDFKQPGKFEVDRNMS